MGDRTHHQDQSILPNNFKVMNTIVSNPLNPPPILIDMLSPISFKSPPNFSESTLDHTSSAPLTPWPALIFSSLIS